jgi:SAM-dependent methyltransferase
VTQSYQGSELMLFAAARHWKRYVADMMAPYIGGRVLEVGAGLGANIPYLHHARVRDWLCLEPDGAMARSLEAKIAAGELPATCRVIAGGMDAVPPGETFDSILYLDVLEHIADDRAELAHAMRLLGQGGTLIVLAPAHRFLFTPFDTAVGHYRRYAKAGLLRAAPAAARLRRCRMLDSVGFFASLGNRVFLRSAQPTAGEIALWDRAMVPISRLLDPLLGYRFGKSVLAVWVAA